MSAAESQPRGLAAGESIDSAILRLLMDNLPDRIYFKDLESRFVRVNAAHAAWLGLRTPDDAIGRTDADFFAPVHANRAREVEQQIVRTGNPFVGQVERIVKTDGRTAWGFTTKLPWRNATGEITGTFGVTRDITALKQVEERLEEERTLLRTIIDHLPARIFVKDTAGCYLINNRAHLEMLGLQRQEETTGRTAREFYSSGRAAQVLADDRQVLSGGPPLLNQEKSDLAAEGTARWSLTTKVPLRDLRGAIVGLVGISHDITERKRVEQELQLRNDEIEADVRMARQIQEVFLPHTFPVFPLGAPPEASALRFAHRYVPAATLGGDFFTVIQLSDTQCGLLVCDVMGHGVRAGLLTALIRGVVEEMGARAASPVAVLGEINRGLAPILRGTGQPVFATVFYGVIDVAAGTLTHANAGHPPAFVVRAGGRGVERLAGANPEPATGLLEAFVYTEHTCEFRSGDIVLAYTDGLFEAADNKDTVFGEERLGALIREHAALPAPELVERLFAGVQAFTGRAEFDDDLCVLAAESTGVAYAILPPKWDI